LASADRKTSTDGDQHQADGEEGPIIDFWVLRALADVVSPQAQVEYKLVDHMGATPSDEHESWQGTCLDAPTDE
jgi:hypothetical protein